MLSIKRSYVFIVVIMIFLGAAYGALNPPPTPNPCIQISIVHPPESARYMNQPIADFNQAYAKGIDPLTDNPLAAGEKCIFVTGTAGSSADVTQGLATAYIAPN